jgi:hypothetical protein
MFTKSCTHENSGVVIKGRWTAELTAMDGSLKDRREGDNLVVTNGKEFMASFLHSAVTGSSWTMQFIAVGTDGTAAALADTGLGTELARHTGTATYTSGAIYEVVGTFAAGVGTGAIVEYGLFSANAAGTMLSRDIEAVINKGSTDTLTVTAQVTIG